MEVSKIQLSEAELELACNADIILTKNTIIRKTISLLENVQERMLHAVGPNATGAFVVSPKISKGENYRGLPYVVLDYPRLSDGGDLIFIRNMFWWGHHFSTTLQVGGKYKALLFETILEAYPLLSAEYYAGVNADPWQHHFGKDNYIRIGELSKKAFAVLLEEQNHIKIAALWPLKAWDGAATYMYECWNQLSGLIAQTM